jgi:hypothetical protein
MSDKKNMNEGYKPKTTKYVEKGYQPKPQQQPQTTQSPQTANTPPKKP